ncbi:MAG: hypothetical protein JXA23_01260 [Bacteroidales bacterium]|nr:hypothetical protein [Bacteroidales bacterium]
MHPRLWILIILTLFTSCGSSTSGGKGKSAGIDTGKACENVRCRKSPGFSYAIYLPSTYRHGVSLPLFLAFDPEGSGIRPVDLYKNLAEKYGFILIGSNDSRNGQDAHQTEQILIALLNESASRYATDPGRIYCTGFSGGSRVASLVAFFRGGIKGVTGCGAGFPSISARISSPADYYGLVGDQDFNYLEMVDLANQFSKQPLRSTLHIFHGTHAWPPPEDFEASVRWHWSNAMKDGMIPEEPSMMSETEKEVQKNQGVLKAIDLSELEKERKRQLFYSEAMQEKTVSWWRQEKEKLDHPSNPSDSLLNKRLVSYLGIIAYTYSNQALATRNKAELERMIGIYRQIEPDNKYIATLNEKLEQLP